jgi:hypothetical protein
VVTEARARRLVIAAAGMSAAGIAIAGTVSRDVGGVVLVAGWLALVYAIHSFGRSTPS